MGSRRSGTGSGGVRSIPKATAGFRCWASWRPCRFRALKTCRRSPGACRQRSRRRGDMAATDAGRAERIAGAPAPAITRSACGLWRSALPGLRRRRARQCLARANRRRDQASASRGPCRGAGTASTARGAAQGPCPAHRTTPGGAARGRGRCRCGRSDSGLDTLERPSGRCPGRASHRALAPVTWQPGSCGGDLARTSCRRTQTKGRCLAPDRALARRVACGREAGPRSPAVPLPTSGRPRNGFSQQPARSGPNASSRLRTERGRSGRCCGRTVR